MNYFRIGILVLLAVALTWLPAAAEDIAAPRHDFPPVGKYQVLIGDFHMHTINSDGSLTTRERVEESARLGYDVIAITDHGKTRACRVAKYVGEQLGMIVLNGLETGIASGEHMNAIGVSSEYVPVHPHRWSKKPGQDTIYYQDAMKQVADAGGFLIYNHPHCGYTESVQWGVDKGYLIGIEVKNDVVGSKWNTTEWHGIYCYPDAFDFALKNNLALFANTDAHGRRNANPARTLLFVEERSSKGVMDAIRARRTAAWFDGMLWGRPELLEELLFATVSICKTADGKLALENKGPISYKAAVNFADQPVDIKPYTVTSVPWTSSDNVAVIIWDNVWTDPLTNLATTHKLQ